MLQYSGSLKINLSALRRNWRFMQSRCGDTECGAVVKANAYGLGIAPIAQALYSEGCRSFFVATLTEALQVKRLLPEPSDIYVLQGCSPGTEGKFIEEGLIPVLVSKAMFHRWLELAPTIKTARCALKVNTGMNRLGISITELKQLVDEQVLPQVGLVALLSHLACADEPGHPLNCVQLDAFQNVVELVKRQVPQVKASFANSAGVLLGKDWHFDLARPGIAIYGGRSLPDSADQLATVVSLMLPVIQSRQIDAGEAVGYGGTFVADKPMAVAVVSGGYADGIMRCLSNRALGWFGQKVPLVGRVSMDSCVFDITHLPLEDRPREGDCIEMFGEHLGLDDLAEAAGTISYEVLTRLGERLQKIYFEDH